MWWYFCIHNKDSLFFMLKNVWTVAYQHGSIVTKTIVPHLPSDRAVEIQYGEIVVGPYSSCHLYQTKDFLNSKIGRAHV